MPSIRIIATPPGFAEESIRQEWVGIQIPLATEAELAENPPSERTIGTQNAGGYRVLMSKAVEALREAGRVGAAVHWERLAFGRYLIFKKEVCELIE